MRSALPSLYQIQHSVRVIFQSHNALLTFCWIQLCTYNVHEAKRKKMFYFQLLFFCSYSKLYYMLSMHIYIFVNTTL